MMKKVFLIVFLSGLVLLGCGPSTPVPTASVLLTPPSVSCEGDVSSQILELVPPSMYSVQKADDVAFLFLIDDSKSVSGNSDHVCEKPLSHKQTVYALLKLLITPKSLSTIDLRRIHVGLALFGDEHKDGYELIVPIKPLSEYTNGDISLLLSDPDDEDTNYYDGLSNAIETLDDYVHPNIQPENKHLIVLSDGYHIKDEENKIEELQTANIVFALICPDALQKESVRDYNFLGRFDRISLFTELYSRFLMWASLDENSSAEMPNIWGTFGFSNSPMSFGLPGDVYKVWVKFEPIDKYGDLDIFCDQNLPDFDEEFGTGPDGQEFRPLTSPTASSCMAHQCEIVGDANLKGFWHVVYERPGLGPLKFSSEASVNLNSIQVKGSIISSNNTVKNLSEWASCYSLEFEPIDNVSVEKISGECVDNQICSSWIISFDDSLYSNPPPKLLPFINNQIAAKRQYYIPLKIDFCYSPQANHVAKLKMDDIQINIQNSIFDPSIRFVKKTAGNVGMDCPIVSSQPDELCYDVDESFFECGKELCNIRISSDTDIPINFDGDRALTPLDTMIGCGYTAIYVDWHQEGSQQEAKYECDLLSLSCEKR